MRIVVDTNVFVGACIGRSPASKVIEACIQERLAPQLSSTLLLEYTDLVGREAIFKNARFSYKQRRKVTENLRDFAFQDLKFPQVKVLNARDFLEFVKS